MFNDNSAGEGGGIFAIANSTLDFEGVNTFNKNRAYVSGGRIWLDNSNLSMCEWEQMFEECVAAYEGGEINRWGNPCTLE